MERRLATKHETGQNNYDKSGIYQLNCPHCKIKYTGQTGETLKYHISTTLQRLQVREQQVEIRPTPLRKQTCIRPNGTYNGHRPHNQQRKNDGHVRKIPHLQRDKIQQPNQRQADS